MSQRPRSSRTFGLKTHLQPQSGGSCIDADASSTFDDSSHTQDHNHVHFDVHLDESRNQISPPQVMSSLPQHGVHYSTTRMAIASRGDEAPRSKKALETLTDIHQNLPEPRFDSEGDVDEVDLLAESEYDDDDDSAGDIDELDLEPENSSNNEYEDELFQKNRTNNNQDNNKNDEDDNVDDEEDDDDDEDEDDDDFDVDILSNDEEEQNNEQNEYHDDFPQNVTKISTYPLQVTHGPSEEPDHHHSTYLERIYQTPQQEVHKRSIRKRRRAENEFWEKKGSHRHAKEHINDKEKEFYIKFLASLQAPEIDYMAPVHEDDHQAAHFHQEIEDFLDGEEDLDFDYLAECAKIPDLDLDDNEYRNDRAIKISNIEIAKLYQTEKRNLRQRSVKTSKRQSNATPLIPLRQTTFPQHLGGTPYFFYPHIRNICTVQMHSHVQLMVESILVTLQKKHHDLQLCQELLSMLTRTQELYELKSNYNAASWSTVNNFLRIPPDIASSFLSQDLPGVLKDFISKVQNIIYSREDIMGEDVKNLVKPFQSTLAFDFQLKPNVNIITDKGQDMEQIANVEQWTPAEDRLLAMGIHKHGLCARDYQLLDLLPAKSAQSIRARIEFLSKRTTPDNPVKAIKIEMARPLTDEEVQLIAHGILIYGKDRWDLIQSFLVPHREKNMLQNLWKRRELMIDRDRAKKKRRALREQAKKAQRQ